MQRTKFSCVVLFCLLFPGASALAAGTGDMAAHPHHNMAMPQNMPVAPTKYRMADYVVPTIELVREDGKHISLPDDLNDGRPVILNFIFTTCTETCPVTTHTFQQLQDKLGSMRTRVHMASVSIDPEQDTPRVLAKYARKFDAGSQWHFYTGTLAASVTVQRAFNAYLGDKMNHNPVTYIRFAPGKPWLRIDGLVTAGELLSALHELAAGKTWMREAGPQARPSIQVSAPEADAVPLHASYSVQRATRRD